MLEYLKIRHIYLKRVRKAETTWGLDGRERKKKKKKGISWLQIFQFSLCECPGLEDDREEARLEISLNRMHTRSAEGRHFLGWEPYHPEPSLLHPLWHDKKYIFGLCPWVLTQSFQNPWDSLGDRSIFYSNEVTLDDLETSEWVPKSFREDQSLTGNVELSALLPIFQEKKWGGDWVNDQLCLCDEVSRKSPKLRGSESIQIGDHIHVSGVAHPNSTPTLYSGLFWVFFTWLFTCSFIKSFIRN